MNLFFNQTGITTYSPLRFYGLDKPGQKIGVVGLGGLVSATGWQGGAWGVGGAWAGLGEAGLAGGFATRPTSS